MEESSFKGNLKHLKEIILDEQRIVTYISICKELCVHVNEAKLLLQEVVEAIKKEQPDIKLNVNYIVSGLSDINKGQVTICSENDLQKFTETFKTIFFTHVYSVNKGCLLLDRNAYTSINTFEDIPLCMGLIKNDNCFKRSSDEIGTLKTNSQVSASSSIIQNAHKPRKETQPIIATKKKSHDEVQNVDKAVDVQKSPDMQVKQEIPSPNMKNNNVTKTVDKKCVTKPSKGITGYFSKANNTSTSKNCNGTVQEAKENKLKIKVEKEIIVNEEKVDVRGRPVIETETKKKVDLKSSSANGTKSKKSLNPIKLNAKVDKKRKRVLHVSDSESDHEESDPFTEQMNVDNDSDDEIPPTPTVNTVKITSGIVNPKKRRKIVDKTYTDEDGYILTKKEEVYESYSENEDEASKKENVENETANKVEISPKGKYTKASKKNISPPQKGKQATMTNFFKKI